MMKTNTARLQRWLDRLTAACGNSKWKSAVAEADCLSAELKQMREELWLQAEGQKEEPLSIKLKNCMAFGGKSFGIAMIIVCLCSFPIAMESGGQNMTASIPTGAESKYEELALVTTEEKDLLKMLRSNLNENNITVQTAQKRSAETKKNYAAKVPVQLPAAKPQAVRAPIPAKADSGKKSIKAEDLLTLIQIGEKSLRGGSSVIKMID